MELQYQSKVRELTYRVERLKGLIEYYQKAIEGLKVELEEAERELKDFSS